MTGSSGTFSWLRITAHLAYQQHSLSPDIPSPSYCLTSAAVARYCKVQRDTVDLTILRSHEIGISTRSFSRMKHALTRRPFKGEVSVGRADRRWHVNVRSEAGTAVDKDQMAALALITADDKVVRSES